jgi:hypothetical protein
MYEVIKTINGIGYRYQQETYRENGKVRTRSTYIGPVDGGRRKKGLTAALRELVKKKDRREDIGETQAEASARVAREDAERAKNERANELLTAPSISLGAIGEIAASQAETATAEAAEASSSESSQASGESDGDAGESGDGEAAA